MKHAESAVRYQQAINDLLKFWHVNGQCKYCPMRTDIKQIIDQQIVIKEVGAFVKK